MLRGAARAAPRLLLLAAAALFPCPPAPVAADPFADAVDAYTPGVGAGFGQDRLPGVVLGPPRGAGEVAGSLDVLSLGHGGEIVLRFDPPFPCDGPGPDLLVFENPFRAGSTLFYEAGFVAAGIDREDLRTFPYETATLSGLAGLRPVFADPDRGVDPTDPEVAGGDPFDLAAIGLPWVRFVRITDAGDRVPDPGNRLPGGTTAGFDLDAVAAVHVCCPPDPDSAGWGDVDGDGVVGPADVLATAKAIFASGDPPGTADLNLDGRLSAADLPAWLEAARASAAGCLHRQEPP